MSSLADRKRELLKPSRRKLITGAAASAVMATLPPYGAAARAFRGGGAAASVAGFADTQWLTLEGDSRMASDGSGSGLATGQVAWALEASGWKCSVDYSGAVGGTTTADMLARLSTTIANSHPKSVCFPLMDVNDYGGILAGAVGVPGTTIDNWYQWLQGWCATGRKVIIPDGEPNNGWEGNAPAVANELAILAWKRDPNNGPAGLFPGQVRVIDYFDTCWDPATQMSFFANFGPIAGKHPNNYGRGTLGLGPMATALASAFSAYPTLIKCPISSSDTYNSSTNPSGCLNTNFMLTGTSSGTFGQEPPNWDWTSSTAAGLTVTTSVGTDSNGFPQVIINLVGTPTAAHPILQFGGTPLSVSNLGVGDNVQAMGRVILDPGSTGICSWGVGIGGHYSFSVTPVGVDDVFIGNSGGTGFDMNILSQFCPVTSPVPSNLKYTWQVVMLQNQPVNATVRLSQAGARKSFLV